MATKAELEAELADLRAQMAANKDDTSKAETNDETESALSGLLNSQNIDSEDLSALWGQLSKELGQLPENKPLLTAVGAFGLGFVLGRMSKH